MKKFSYDEAMEQSIKYFGNELSANVFVGKYALKDQDGNIYEPTPDYMHDRLAEEFARIDKEKYNLDYEGRRKIYREVMDKFARVVPQGSPMFAIGNKFQVSSASNCVVVESPKDSIGGIVDTGKDLAELYKRRCGCGVDISTLRPDGFGVNNSAKTTSGAWSFADFYSYITRMIGQENRRGALMITMSVHHPDILKFATMKQDKTKVTGANVSIRLSDDFLKAVENDTDYEQRWPEEGRAKITKKVRARDVWNVIVNSATKTAEPGLLLWDSLTSNLPAHYYDDFKTISTNPCSEIGLSAYDSCRLISLNLTGYVKKAFDQDGYFDFDLFTQDISVATQMADNLVDLELELITKIQSVCEEGHEKQLWQKLHDAGKNGRRTGLGSHGLADCLAQLNIKYDSAEAITMIDKIYKTLRDTAYGTSINLAEIRGAFPVFDHDKEKSCSFTKRLPTELKNKMREVGRRNIALLTQAPTGSVSIISKVGEFDSYNVSSGVEPVFRNAYTRRKKINGNENVKVDFVDIMGDRWQEFKVFHSNIKNYMDKFEITDEAKLPDFFTTSDQVSWEKRVEIQATEQQYIDHSISSTVNLPEGTSVETVGNIYLDAWKKGLKGITVYVDKSRDGVLITNKDDVPGTITRPKNIVPVMSPKRPPELFCDIHYTSIKGKRWIVLVGTLAGDPYEIFTGLSEDISLPSKCIKGKIVKTSRGQYNLHVDIDGEDLIIKDIVGTFDNQENAWATRMISTALRHGTPIDFIVEQLSKDGGMGDVNKCLSRVMKKYIKDGMKVRTNTICEGILKDGSRCGSENLIYSEGCSKCMSCGYSKCS